MPRVLIAIVGGLLLGTLSAVAAAGHGELVLQLGAERIQPGGTIEVRGDLGSGEAFQVALISKADGSRRAIATIPAVDEGHFQSFVTVPADLPSGDYLIEVAVDLVVMRAPLTVTGVPIAPDGGGRPEQEEGLIQPLPSASGAAGSFADGVEASPVPTAQPPPFDGPLIVAIATIAAIGLLVSIRLASRRRVPPNPGTETDTR